MSKFVASNHIIGKVYDLTQENMNAMLAEIEALRMALKPPRVGHGHTGVCQPGCTCDRAQAAQTYDDGASAIYRVGREVYTKAMTEIAEDLEKEVAQSSKERSDGK